MNYKILIMAAGTGGHVFPALAVAELMRKNGITVIWLGTQTGIEQTLVPAAGFALKQVTIKGLRGKGIMGWLSAPVRIAMAFIQSMQVIHSEKPNLVLGMGGYVTGPAGLAAWVSGIPLVIHEQNRVPGLTNRLLAKIARRVLMAFPDTFTESHKTRVVGNPVRESIMAIEPVNTRFANHAGNFRVLVIGGSQGAVALNEAVPKVLQKLTEFNFSVHHQTGKSSFEQTQKTYIDAGIDAVVSPFIDDMAAEYAWADLVICRSGALTISELVTAGLGAILVPFPYAVDDHQYVNACYMEKNNAAIVIRQTEQLLEKLHACLLELFRSGRDALLNMAVCAKELAVVDSTRLVFDECNRVQHG